MAVARIPEALKPGYLTDILAKSADLGGDTLAEHTWAVLNRLADQRRLRSRLADQLREPRIWHRLYWGCFLHDFGKAASGFQQRLRVPKAPNEWSLGGHRHEVLSLAFADAVFPQGHADRMPVLAVIIAHHRDFEGEVNRAILPRYGGRKPDEQQVARTQFLIDQLNPELITRMWRWFNDYGVIWSQAVGFDEKEVEPVTIVSGMLNASSIRRALSDFSVYNVSRKDGMVPTEAVIWDMHYRGLILTADHAASAGSPPFPSMGLTAEIANRPLAMRNCAPNAHQVAVTQTRAGSAILIAPTGSGKTEAALRWAVHQMDLRPASRLFYTLPYQASMNSMAERLCTAHFGAQLSTDANQQVTIQHSRSTLKLYQLAMEADSGAVPHSASRRARDHQDRTRLNYYPVQIFSPYQMLKAAYQLKGYEAMLVDYTGALFIFDEIHAYDPARMALIVTFMGWLARHLGSRFLVMTATLPPMVREKLLQTLPGCEEIFADSATFEKSRRHIVRLHSDDLLGQLNMPFADWAAGQSVLICCNTVARAQMAYIALKDRVQALGMEPGDHIMLLHGRFNGKDRGDKERLLAERVGVGVDKRRPMLIVATQVIEVSLNIDLDTLYTDPAPLEALLQRFGRVNRGRETGQQLPVHVFREPIGEKASKPYDHRVVKASLAVLEQHCADRDVNEAHVTRMLGEMYRGEIETAWKTTYDHKYDEFSRILDSMRPFVSADWALERQFYDLFDGWQVLPKDCYHAYEAAVIRHDQLGANQYLVNVNTGQYHMLEGKGWLCEQEEGQYFRQTTVPYNSEFGLDLNRQLAEDDDV